MLILLLSMLIVIGYAIVARRSGGHLLAWPLVGLLSFLGSYWVWKLLFLRALVRDSETLAWFLVVGMLIGLIVSVIVMNTLLRGTVARQVGRDKGAGRPAPVIAPPTIQRRHYLLPVGVALALAVVSIALQHLGVIHNEIGPGGMFPAGIAGAIGGVVLQRPLRSLLLGIGLGLAYAVLYAPGLHLIGKLPLRGGEAILGALIGLPLTMIISAVAVVFLAAVCARSIQAIGIYTRWLREANRSS
jgi:hypothetical protein